MSTLVEERDKWRKEFESRKLDNSLLNDYRKNRDSNEWRVSRVVEQLCEYILYLEGGRQ